MGTFPKDNYNFEETRKFPNSIPRNVNQWADFLANRMKTQHTLVREYLWCLSFLYQIFQRDLKGVKFLIGTLKTCVA